MATEDRGADRRKPRVSCGGRRRDIEGTHRTAVVALVASVLLFSLIFWWSAVSRTWVPPVAQQRLVAKEIVASVVAAKLERGGTDLAPNLAPTPLDPLIAADETPLEEDRVANIAVLRSGGGRLLASSTGLVLLFHGCTQTRDAYRFLPHYRTAVRALHAAGFFCVALSSADAEESGEAGGCWDARSDVDVSRAAAVAGALLASAGLLPRVPAAALAAAGLTSAAVGQAEGRSPAGTLPVFAFGSSSGGGFAGALALRLQLAGAGIYIMALPRSLASASSEAGDRGDAGALGPALEPGGGGRFSEAWLAGLPPAAGGQDALGLLRTPVALPPLLLLPMPRDGRLRPLLGATISALARLARVSMAPGLASKTGYGLSSAAVAAATQGGVAAAAAAAPGHALSGAAAARLGAYANAGASPAAGISLLPLTPRPLCPWTVHAEMPWAVSPAASAALFQVGGGERRRGAVRALAERGRGRGVHLQHLVSPLLVRVQLLADWGALAAHAAAQQPEGGRAPLLADALAAVDAAAASEQEGGDSSGRTALPPPAALPVVGAPETAAAAAPLGRIFDGSVAFELSAWPPLGMRIAEGQQEQREKGGATAEEEGSLSLQLLIDGSGGPLGVARACRELAVSGRSPVIAEALDAWLGALAPAPQRPTAAAASPPSPPGPPNAVATAATVAADADAPAAPGGGAGGGSRSSSSPDALPLPAPVTGHAELDAFYWTLKGLLPLPLLQAGGRGGAGGGGGSGGTVAAVTADPTAAAQAAVGGSGPDALRRRALHWLRRGAAEVLNELEAVHEMSGQHAEAAAAWARGVAEGAGVADAAG